MIDPIRLPCGHKVERTTIRQIMVSKQCPRPWCNTEVNPATLKYRVTFLKETAQFLSAMAVTAAVFRGDLIYTYLHLALGYFLCGNSRLPLRSTDLPIFTVTDNLGAIGYGIGAALLILGEEEYYTSGLILIDLSTLFLAAQHMGENLVLWVGGDR